MRPKFEVREALRTLERAGLENKLPVWDDGRMIVEEGHVALKGDEMVFATRRYRAPYGLEQVEMRQEGKELDAAGPLYVALTEYKKTGPATPSPLSVDTPGDKRSGPVEDRFRRILERREAESREESMDETLSEAGEDMEVGNTPEQKPSEEEFTTQELLKDLSGENWADTPTPPLTSSPRKNPELPLTSENPNMGMILLSAERREKNTFEGNRDAFLGSLDEDAWRRFLSDFNREVDDETTLDDFKEELWDTVVKFGEPVLMAMRLDPMGMIRGLEEVVTCIYGPAVTYAFPDPLVTAYRYSVTHVSLISIQDGTTLNWCQQEVLRAQMSNTVLFGKVKDPELVLYGFRGQLQCRMGGKREGPMGKHVGH